jgi:DNA modification methylase
MKLDHWELNQTHNAEALEALSLLPNDCVDVIITSPPYWGQRESLGIGCETDPRDYVNATAKILSEAMRCLTPKGLMWLNIGDAYNTPINWRKSDSKYSTLGADGTGLDENNSAYTKKRGRRKAFIEKDTKWLQYGNLLALPQRIVMSLCDEGYLFRGEVVWRKSRAMPEGRCRRPHRKHESIYILAKSEKHRFRVKPPVDSVWELTQTPNKTKHTSSFPIDLPRTCIKASDLPKNAIVLDPFMGSGTTAEAAVELGFNYIGFEIDKEMCEIANTRTPVQTSLLK